VFANGQSAASVLGQTEFSSAESNTVGPGGLALPSHVLFDAAGRLFVTDTENHRVLIFDDLAAAQNHGSASVVLGQPDAMSRTSSAGPTGLSSPSGLTLDPSGNLYVSDTGNHRIVRFDNVAVATTGAAASVVVGQPDFFASAPQPVGAATLNAPVGVLAASDAARDIEVLYAVDGGNNRVVRYDDLALLSDGASASAVFGQPDFDSNAAGILSMDGPSGVALLEDGTDALSLFVSDARNDRVLRYGAPFDGGAVPALGVLGQPSLDSVVSGSLVGCSETGPREVDCSGTIIGDTAAVFDAPAGLAAFADGLLVADTGNTRVLWFDEPFVTGDAANDVLAQSSFTRSDRGLGVSLLSEPSGLAVGPSPDGQSAFIYITDRTNNRVVAWESLSDRRTSTQVLVGQQGYLNRAPNLPSALRFSDPRGIAVDPLSGAVFIVDNANHRVLRFSTLSALANGEAADAVLGQPDFQSNFRGEPSGASNVDGTRMNSPSAAVCDRLGNLYVAGSFARRVLRFDAAATLPNGAAASIALGQPDLQTARFSDTSAASIRSPIALAIDPENRLYVADAFDRRVLRFDSPATASSGAEANGVLGQADFVSAELITSGGSSSFRRPSGLAVSADGTLWVADSANNRILRFDDAANAPNGAQADSVLGQPDFDSIGVSIEPRVGLRRPEGLAVDGTGGLYVADSGYNRVLVFVDATETDIGAGADVVLGQPDFLSTNSGLGQSTLANPVALAFDTLTNSVFVVDGGNDRVMRFAAQEP
ncbi:MAG: NHL repeat-containing protein, partial [Myxococcota bacterium]